jgi:hypothetical protein
MSVVALFWCPAIREAFGDDDVEQAHKVRAPRHDGKRGLKLLVEWRRGDELNEGRLLEAIHRRLSRFPSSRRNPTAGIDRAALNLDSLQHRRPAFGEPVDFRIDREAAAVAAASSAWSGRRILVSRRRTAG